VREYKEMDLNLQKTFKFFLRVEVGNFAPAAMLSMFIEGKKQKKEFTF
jgi:hypothetical protein